MPGGRDNSRRRSMTRMNAQISDSRPLSEQVYEAGLEWADADAAARMLESLKSAFLAQKISERADMPISRAENEVKASLEWKDYVVKMERSRTKANKLKIRREFLEARAWEAKSAEATERLRARL